ncbi:class I SAM-dependent methyltransferase [Pinibacter soli]|uniref:Class I SAM-dependent methyltransferase n=1 Tax=Pinibacter soli TaxID=3044211 RepID=A0ABT6R7T5_9BACT|nr:class I SAM-dependent methyltransferase [Pinibacter soli]MDI3318625.1 class I SAM-dependent methyltransferase [Pinibacter soli]
MIKKIKDIVRWQLYKGLYKPGHFYSTIPNLKEVTNNSERIFTSATPAGIDLNLKEQQELLETLASFYEGFDWPVDTDGRHRYFSNNNYFNYSDAYVLYGIMRKFSPKKIVEIGSGFSSALMMDVNDRFFNGAINMNFIEPFPDRLNSLIGKGGSRPANITLIEKMVQEVPLEIFSSLQANDILFIDSSHVSKVGSDLNHILFNIIPLLKKGVLVHFHDITYPFEYPEEWIKKGMYWNEAYLLRAFLMYNNAYSILLMNSYWANKPSVSISGFGGGGSIWLQKNG